MDAFFTVPFKRIPGVSPVVVEHDLQVDVATDESDQVEHAITVPAGLSGSQLVVMIIAQEQLVGIEEGSLEFEVKVEVDTTDEGEGEGLFGYAFVLPAPAAGVHTVLLTFADECTPATFLAVLSGVLADSVEGSPDSSEDDGVAAIFSSVPVLPPSNYAFCLDLIAAAAPAAFTAIHGQTMLAADDDVLSAAVSYKSDLNRGVAQVTAWRIDPAAAPLMHVALICGAAGQDVEPPPPPEEIADVAIWLLDEPSGATAADSVGAADGVITGLMEYGLDDLVDGADTCMAGDGSTAKIIAPHAEAHQLAGYTLDFLAQADEDPQVQETWLAKDQTIVGERPPGGLSIERRWNGTASRLAAYTRNAGAGAIWIEGGATPDAEHGVADWPAEDAVHIHLVVDPEHETELTRLYLDGSKVATSTNIQGLQANLIDWSFFCFKNNPTSFAAFSDGMIYRVRLRDLPLSDAEVAAEVSGEPAVSITHGETPVSDYDAEVEAFAANLISYWKFQNTGLDEAGTQNAAISGSPELDVETIVDLDRIAEGAAADGRCIAWSGATGTYAEAAHNAAHKTAEGSIIITFQRDAAAVKSTLMAADRSNGGTATGPGGFSIEVETNGAPRCFLRNAAGAATVLLGTAGDVALDAAYTAVFKWGTGGLSYAIWNAAGTLVRRLTNALADGLSGTSPIRFGAWHTDVSHHDGPFARVIWLDRRISNAEEEDLARARTIDRGGEEPPPPEPGDYTPFPYVLTASPNNQNLALPAFNAQDPEAASQIDPNSGLRFWQILPHHASRQGNGTIILANGADSGFHVKATQRHQSAPSNTSWNCDGTLLALYSTGARSLDSQSGGPITPALLMRTSDWRIIDVDMPDMGAAFWHPDNPQLMIRWSTGGSWRTRNMITGADQALFSLSGYTMATTNGGNTSVTNPGRNGYARKWGGVAPPGGGGPRYQALIARRVADNMCVMFRVRLDPPFGKSGDMELGPCVADNNAASWARIDGRVMSKGVTTRISATGRYCLGVPGPGVHVLAFEPPPAGTSVSLASRHVGTVGLNATLTVRHPDSTVVNGDDVVLGVGAGNPTTLTRWNINTGEIRRVASFPDGSNPNTTSTQGRLDLAETYGHGGGGQTTGRPWAVFGKVNRLLAVRVGPNDEDEIRYLGNPRGTMDGDDNMQADPVLDPTGRYVLWASNWRGAGGGIGGSGGPCTAYVTDLRDAWRSPNTDGSAA